MTTKIGSIYVYIIHLFLLIIGWVCHLRFRLFAPPPPAAPRRHLRLPTDAHKLLKPFLGANTSRSIDRSTCDELLRPLSGPGTVSESQIRDVGPKKCEEKEEDSRGASLKSNRSWALRARCAVSKRGFLLWKECTGRTWRKLWIKWLGPY